MSMPMEENGPGEPGMGGPPQGGGDPIQMLLGLVDQAMQSLNQVGAMIQQLAGPQGPPQGGGNDPRAAAIASMIQKGG